MSPRTAPRTARTPCGRNPGRRRNRRGRPTDSVLKQPTDYYIEYCFKETLKQLQSLRSEFTLPADPETLAIVLEKLTDDDLKKAPAIEPVLHARLGRKTIDAGAREGALKELAKLQKKKKELAKTATSTATSSSAASVATTTEEPEEQEEDDADLLAEDDEDDEGEAEVEVDDSDVVPLKTKGKR